MNQSIANQYSIEVFGQAFLKGSYIERVLNDKLVTSIEQESVIDALILAQVR